jgi:TonB family protein
MVNPNLLPPIVVACVRSAWLGILLLCVAPRVGYAGCSIKPYDAGFGFSKSALEVRDSFFASLCDESFSELVVFPDPRLAERFSPPSNGRQLVKESGYPSRARRLGFEGDPVVAYVVEADGSVEHVIVIESSGHQVLDEAAVADRKQSRFDTPGTLDGIPVRVLSTYQMVFKIQGTARLPAAFTDAVIAEHGSRLIDFCNRGDVDALYEGLDEAAKHKISRADIKQQLRLYNALYGEIAGARYEGLLGAEIQDGVHVYELAYALDLERPGAENVLMRITVADRVEYPRVLHFRIDRAMTLYRPHRGNGSQ